MTAFIRRSAHIQSTSDSIFAMTSLATKDLQNNPDLVINATIGSLYGEDGKLAAYDSVFNHYDNIDHIHKAKYAESFSGNAAYREAVFQWATAGADVRLPHNVIATPGGTGALSSIISSTLDAGDTLLLPDIAWGNYKTMATSRSMKPDFYSMFDGDAFNIASIKEKIEEIQSYQDRVVLIVNDPCQNPTGYSMSDAEWAQLIDIVNEASKKTPVVLINDTAYIDYSYDVERSRLYMNHFNDLSENVLLVIAFSASKTLTFYGMRCGAAILMAKDESALKDITTIMEQHARATWSNIPNAAMENFAWVTGKNRDAFLEEKNHHIEMMKERSALFLKEAKECGLDTYPYKEGFFVSLRIPDEARKEKIHEAFVKDHIYTIPVKQGIRIAVCSLPLAKVKGLAYRMKKISESL